VYRDMQNVRRLRRLACLWKDRVVPWATRTSSSFSHDCLPTRFKECLLECSSHMTLVVVEVSR
jgi:hypothetical protein